MMQPRSFWVRWRVRFGYPVALAYLFLARPTARSFFYGFAVGMAGLLIRGWAAGFLRKHEALATNGPYARTRNPLYLGSAVLAAGLVVAGHSLWAGAIVIVYLLVFYPMVMRREGAELRARYGAAFEDYAGQVPLFWPRIRAAQRLGEKTVRFSGQLYWRNREYQALVGFLIGLGLLWAKMRWVG